MASTPQSPPVIPPLPDSTVRPLWSVMIPVYNCGQFLEKTLISVLEQGIPERDMQVEVVDDASTDIDVRELVYRLGNGRIKYYRQPQNVGSLSNFATCINRSRGRLIHLLHGDDYVEFGYYTKIEELFKKYPEAGAAFCRYRCVDESGMKVYQRGLEMKQDGILKNWLIAISERQRTQYVAMTVRREVYEHLGSFFGIVYGEDWEMWVRIAKHYPVAYTPQLLANYRKQSSSISSSKITNGEYLQDLEEAMKLIQCHLPAEKRSATLNRSKRFFANYGLKVARELWHKSNDEQLVQHQIQKVLGLYRSPLIYLKIAGLQLQLKLHKLWL